MGYDTPAAPLAVMIAMDMATAASILLGEVEEENPQTTPDHTPLDEEEEKEGDDNDNKMGLEETICLALPSETGTVDTATTIYINNTIVWSLTAGLEKVKTQVYADISKHLVKIDKKNQWCINCTEHKVLKDFEFSQNDLIAAETQKLQSHIMDLCLDYKNNIRSLKKENLRLEHGITNAATVIVSSGDAAVKAVSITINRAQVLVGDTLTDKHLVLNSPLDKIDMKDWTPDPKTPAKCRGGHSTCGTFGKNINPITGCVIETSSEFKVRITKGILLNDKMDVNKDTPPKTDEAPKNNTSMAPKDIPLSTSFKGAAFPPSIPIPAVKKVVPAPTAPSNKTQSAPKRSNVKDAKSPPLPI